jgi:hypothetical protein
LTRASIPLQKNLAKKMDGRVKPGHDDSAFGTVPALRSGMKNAAPRPGHETMSIPLETVVEPVAIRRDQTGRGRREMDR